MLRNYAAYLNFLNSKLEKFFEKQKPYIFCHKGCAKCCKNAEFPYSELEVQYLLAGYSQLPPQTRQLILERINKLVEDKKNCKDENFVYDCPFLIDDVCSVYQYRGIVCRTFGLIANANDKRSKIPFCYKEGLNYSNVIDPETNRISPEKLAKCGFNEIPVSFNIRHSFLTCKEFEEGFGVKFGEVKPLIDWFVNS